MRTAPQSRDSARSAAASESRLLALTHFGKTAAASCKTSVLVRRGHFSPRYTRVNVPVRHDPVTTRSLARFSVFMPTELPHRNVLEALQDHCQRLVGSEIRNPISGCLQVILCPNSASDRGRGHELCKRQGANATSEKISSARSVP